MDEYRDTIRESVSGSKKSRDISTAQITAAEQCKALPDEARVKLMEHLRSRVGTNRGGTVNVIKQERNGKLNDRLKTDAAYRSVPLPYIGLRLIEERREYLKAQGVSERDIDRLPCVCRKNSIYEMELSKEVSKLGRELIAKCVGSKSGFIANAETAMKLYPDLDDDTKDLAAYVFRRDYCTRASNICKERIMIGKPFDESYYGELRTGAAKIKFGKEKK